MLEKLIGPSTPGIDKIQFLKDNCDEVEKLGYTRNFTQDELDGMKDDLADVSIDINDIEVEKKETNAEFKKRLDTLKDERKDLLEKIRTRSEFVNEECFKFIDHESETTGYYNKEGELVSTRRIKPEERQTNIRQFARLTGTND